MTKRQRFQNRELLKRFQQSFHLWRLTKHSPPPPPPMAAAARVQCHNNTSFTGSPLPRRHHNSSTLHASPNRVNFTPLKWIGDGSSSCTRTVSGRPLKGGGTTTVRAAFEEEKKTDAVNEVAEEKRRFTCVMKFGGSSVATAERMREVADLVLTFPEESPVIVLSAMGKTTNNLLLVNAVKRLSLCVLC